MAAAGALRRLREALEKVEAASGLHGIARVVAAAWARAEEEGVPADLLAELREVMLETARLRAPPQKMAEFERWLKVFEETPRASRVAPPGGGGSSGRPHSPPPPPPPLVEDAVGEILLRLPPDDPACLVRASLVCKLWRRILADPAFLRLYRDFHRTPPVLGFFHQPAYDIADFIPITSFRPSSLEHGRCVLDCRHGRVLLEDSGDLLVWDPATGGQLRLPELPDTVPQWRNSEGLQFSVYCNAAVLCAMGAGCDHRGCSGGPFLVIFLGINQFVAHACLYSSETSAWCAPTSIHYGYMESDLEMVPAACVGEAVYFLGHFATILRYDLRRRSLSVIGLPSDIGDDFGDLGTKMVMPSEDGKLVLGSLDGYILHLWSRETGSDGTAQWGQRRVIDVEALLPVRINPRGRQVRQSYFLPEPDAYFSGFVDAGNIIFVSIVDVGVFSIDLKSLTTKVCEMGTKLFFGRNILFFWLFPYSSFYTPACGSRRLVSSLGTQ
ncbi:hypothetical protein ACP70R_007112 [Stipagrostis hirtigluma subsp. patula]